MDKTFSESLKAAGLKTAISYFDRNPVKNIPRIISWILRHDKGGLVSPQAATVRDSIGNPDSNWYKLLLSLWDDVDSGVRKRIFENFVINASMLGSPKQRKLSRQYGCNIPWAILMDPTSACNLHCAGCWAAGYGGKLSLTLEEMDGVIRQAKKMGVCFYLFSGGEPLVRKDDVIRLCAMHPDCMFLAFTNGTLIDEKFADDMLRVKNFVPAISIEGFRSATDSRRGEGTYDKAVAAMNLLKSKKLGFGISLTYTSANTEEISSDEYMDAMIKLGAKFAWFFTYIPLGINSVPGLLASPGQRETMYRQIRKWRAEKPIFTMDFWNDGEFAHGCIAGGRRYLHINANGDIEPCAFVHYSDANIRENTLLEAMQKPLFMQYYQNQPFSSNMLRPCPLLDVNGKLAEMVRASGAHSTNLEEPEDADSLCAKCARAAEAWKPVADRLWEESGSSLREHKITA